MNDQPAQDSPLADSTAIAARLVSARLRALALPAFPGVLPTNMNAAYRCQDAAIDLWPDQVRGWKVGYISADRRDTDGDDRVIGPIFERQIWDDPGHSMAFPVFVGGFAAVEAEYVFRIGTDAPAKKLQWSDQEAAELVASLHIGVETAGSPMAMINLLGPCAVASDFGNNAGLILGREIPDWREQPASNLRCATSIDDVEVGRGGVERIPGGLLAALAFALGRCAQRGLPMRAGMLITTGAATGIHDIVAGQRSVIEFGPWGCISCHAVAASPDPVHAQAWSS